MKAGDEVAWVAVECHGQFLVRRDKSAFAAHIAIIIATCWGTYTIPSVPTLELWSSSAGHDIIRRWNFSSNSHGPRTAKRNYARAPT